MSNPGVSDKHCIEALRAFDIYGNKTAAAQSLGLPRNTFCGRLLAGQARFPDGIPRAFEVEPLPSETPSIEELLERRKREYQRIDKAKTARRLIPIKINIDGPIGIAHFGDPHVDDPGTDIVSLERHMKLVRETDGMFAANVGDLSNNWVGRLARLYAEQATTSAEAWILVEWLFRSVEWLYIIAGNHDLWSGDGDPAQWIAKHTGQIYEAHGVRCNLLFPNGKEVRVNARHDFSGHSMWNPNHGPMKAAQAGWRDHILTAGHKHVSFISGPLKDPSNGLLSWAIRVAGYKIHDRYAEEKGLPDQNAFAACVTVIDPTKADDDPGLVTVFADVDMAADYLTWLRNKTC